MQHGTYVKLLSRVSHMDIVCHKLISIPNVHCIPSVYYNYMFNWWKTEPDENLYLSNFRLFCIL